MANEEIIHRLKANASCKNYKYMKYLNGEPAGRDLILIMIDSSSVVCTSLSKVSNGSNMLFPTACSRHTSTPKLLNLMNRYQKVVLLRYSRSQTEVEPFG